MQFDTLSCHAGRAVDPVTGAVAPSPVLSTTFERAADGTLSQGNLYHDPGLTSHPGHGLARRQMSDFGAMVSFEVAGGRDAAVAVAARVRLFTRATSLGGYESLIEHRATAEGPQSTTPPGLLRCSIGLEHPDDLVADLRQALDGVC